MDTVPFGGTDWQTSRLGVGLSEIGSELSANDVEQAAGVLNNALDNGINFLDTAACYGVSEELVGKAVSGRRNEYFLATKAGHAVGGHQGSSWTYQTVTDSVDRSLKRMNTDHVDLVQLHSCGIDVLEKGDVIRALEDARDAGKTRYVGYSGDNQDAHWAVDSGLFASLQTSFNLADQRALTTGLLEKADKAGMGVIIKRPIANGVWGAAKNSSSWSGRSYAQAYFERAREIAAQGDLPGEPDDPILLAMGFTFARPEVDVAIIGTKNPNHMTANIQLVNEQLPIEASAVSELELRFKKMDRNWVQRT